MKNTRYIWSSVEAILWCGCLAMLLLLVSCKGKPTAEEMGVGTDEFLRTLEVYAGEDIDAAEQALLSYRSKLDEAEAQGVEGIRYDAARGLVDSRLFLIYEQKGSPKADELYPKLVEHFNSERVYGGLAPTNFTRESLIEDIEYFDRTLDVKWKED